MMERMQDTRKREALDARLGITVPKSEKELAAEDADRHAQRKTLLQWADEYLAKKKNLGVDSHTPQFKPALRAKLSAYRANDLSGRSLPWVPKTKIV